MCFPHIFVWGSCFLSCILSSAPAASSAQLCHTQFFTHDFATHTHNLSHTHTTLSHTIFQAHNFVTHTHSFVTHTALSHTTLSYTRTRNLPHTTVCHTIFHTRNFVTHTHTRNFVAHTHTHTQSFPHTRTHTHTRNLVTHNLSKTESFTRNFVTQSSTQLFVTHTHTTLSHTHSLSRAIFQIQLCHTHTHTHNLSHTTLCRTQSLSHTQLCDIQSFTHNDAAALCVAGVALGDAGAKHISKSKRQTHPSPGTPPETEMHILGGQGQGADFLRGDALWSIKSSGFAKMILRNRCSTSYDLASLFAAGAIL